MSDIRERAREAARTAQIRYMEAHDPEDFADPVSDVWAAEIEENILPLIRRSFTNKGCMYAEQAIERMKEMIADE